MDYIITKIINEFEEDDICPKAKAFDSWIPSYFSPLIKEGEIPKNFKLRHQLLNDFGETPCTKEDFEKIFNIKVDHFLEVPKVDHSLNKNAIDRISEKLLPYLDEYTLEEVTKAFYRLCILIDTSRWNCDQLCLQLKRLDSNKYYKLLVHRTIVNKLAS